MHGAFAYFKDADHLVAINAVRATPSGGLHCGGPHFLCGAAAAVSDGTRIHYSNPSPSPNPRLKAPALALTLALTLALALTLTRHAHARTHARERAHPPGWRGAAAAGTLPI